MGMRLVINFLYHLDLSAPLLLPRFRGCRLRNELEVVPGAQAAHSCLARMDHPPWESSRGRQLRGSAISNATPASPPDQLPTESGAPTLGTEGPIDIATRVELDIATRQRVEAGWSAWCGRIEDRPVLQRDVELVAGARFALVIAPHGKVDVGVRRVVRPSCAADDTGTGGLVRRPAIGHTTNEILEVARDGEPVNGEGDGDCWA